MSDVNAVIVQPFKQFVKARRAASKTNCRDAPAALRRLAPTLPFPRRASAASVRPDRAFVPPRTGPGPRPSARCRETHHATHTPPPRRRRRRDTDPSPTQDSIHLVKKCTKPDRKEFARIASATMIGFLIMGFVGFFVKLVHIPINNILMT